MKDLERGDLICGIIYLSKRLGREMPDWEHWSSFECRVYLLGLESQLKKG